jgi:hypothetical protein
MYLNGNGVFSSVEHAAFWFSKAAGYGYTEAEYELGVMYATGQGAPLDNTAAMDLFRRAAKKGHTKAQQRVDG